MYLIHQLKAVAYQPYLKTSDSPVVSNPGNILEIIAINKPNFLMQAVESLAEGCKTHITNHSQSQSLSLPFFLTVQII